MRSRPPLLLLRLSAEQAHSGVPTIDETSTGHHSQGESSPSPVGAAGNITPSTSSHSPCQSNIALPSSLLVPSPPDSLSMAGAIVATQPRSHSSGTPLFNMFKINTRSRSPKGAGSASATAVGPSLPLPSPSGMYRSSIISKPISPSSSSSMATAEPSPRPFSPWGSTDSSTSTSPRTPRMPKGFFTSKKSPTASSSFMGVGGAQGNSSSALLVKSSKSFLGRRSRKNSVSREPEFDPTTLRKNRKRPAPGIHRQDALYQEYEDLFDDSLDDSVNEEEEEDDSASHPSDGNEDEDGYYLLRLQKPVIGPRVSSRTRSPPRSVPPKGGDGRDLSTGPVLNPPPPPSPHRPAANSPSPVQLEQRHGAPKFKQSLVVITTMPPSDSGTSFDSHSGFSAATTVVSAPPTPSLSPLDADRLQAAGNITTEARPTSTTQPPPPPPPSPGKRLSDRLSRILNRPRSIPDGLGIINIPSPTLFFSSFNPGASEKSVPPGGGIASNHATFGTPALTTGSYTSLQPLRKTPSHDGSLNKRISAPFRRDQGHSLAAPPPFPPNRDGTASKSSEDLTNSNSTQNMTQTAVEEVAVEVAAPAIPTTTITWERLDCPVDLPAELPVYTEKAVDDAVAIPEAPPAEKDVVDAPTDQITTTKLDPPPPKTTEEKPAETKVEAPKVDSSYLKAFRGFIRGSGDSDPFIHRMPRFDALQAQRICSHLKNENPLVTNNKKKSAPPRPAGARREAGEEILTSLWALMAMRWMNFGRVVISPGHEALLAASARRLNKRAVTKMDVRATQMLGKVTGEIPVGGLERRRVLDLGGQPIADWGWHCAYDYPKAKVYTVTCTPPLPPTTPPPSSSSSSSETSEKPSRTARATPQKYRGPQNHRHVTVPKLWKLPFPSNHFDVVSARTLYLTLKCTVPAGSVGVDEYDLCLDECLRVLKPGGHLEFSLFDNDIVNAGPLGAALATSFSEGLKANGYDAAPTKRWVSRLNKAGFGEIKRSWLFLPMSPPPTKLHVPTKDDLLLPMHESQDLEMVKEEVRRKLMAWEDLGIENGNAENVSPVTGLLGSWMWINWMRKTNDECGGEEERVKVRDIGDVLDEGRQMGSGWRSLVGWARKPMFTGDH